MTTCLHRMNAIGDAANLWSAWTQTGRQSILILTFSHTIYVKCKFLN